MTGTIETGETGVTGALDVTSPCYERARRDAATQTTPSGWLAVLGVGRRLGGVEFGELLA